MKKKKKKRTRMRVISQREKRENCEICGGGGWVRWGTCGPKNLTSFFFVFFLLGWAVTLCLTEPSPRDIGGQIYRKRHKSM